MSGRREARTRANGFTNFPRPRDRSYGDLGRLVCFGRDRRRHAVCCRRCRRPLPSISPSNSARVGICVAMSAIRTCPSRPSSPISPIIWAGPAPPPAGIGFGYQYNSWLRTDFEIDRAVFRPSSAQAPIWCPSGTDSRLSGGRNANVASPGGAAGFLYNPNETCTPYVTAHLNRTTPMFNAYIDLGNWWGFTPYVGAGIGISYLQSSGAVAY